METKKDESFGVIPIYKTPNNSFLFCLVFHSWGHWAFPKGHKDEGESDLDAALRELKEETGIVDVALVKDKTFTEKYTFTYEGIAYDKTVTYFLGFAQSIDTKTDETFKDEIPELKWMTYEEAKEIITYSNAKELLEEVQTYLQSGK